jgi:hypothetical protein
MAINQKPFCARAIPGYSLPLTNALNPAKEIHALASLFVSV